MIDYRLEVLLLLRRRTADDAWLERRAAASAAREEDRERQRITAEIDTHRCKAAESYPTESRAMLLLSARSRTTQRDTVRDLRQRLALQDQRLRQALARDHCAAQELAEARAAQEALEVHRRRWLEARRAEREAAEEREAEDWFLGRCSR